MFLAGEQALKKGIALAPKLAPKLTRKSTEYDFNKKNK